MPLHRWCITHCLPLKSKGCPDTTIESDWRFQMSCKAFFSGKSPYITLSSGKCLIRVRIYIFTLLEFSFFYKLCDFRQVVRSDAIWGQLCEIAPSRNIRWPDVHWIWQQKVIFNLASKNYIVSNVKVSLKFYFLLLKLDPHNCWNSCYSIIKAWVLGHGCISAARGAIYYVAIATVIFSRVEMVKLSCFCVKAHRISLGFIS